MFRKLLGFISGVLALGSAMFVIMALADLTGGTSATAPGVLMGLFVFFGGLTPLMVWSAVRLLRDPRPAISTGSKTTAAHSTDGIDIALEAEILKLAARNDGRITATEVALGCGVSLDAAAQAIDLLAVRGYADLAVTPEGDAVYVIKGFVSQQEKHLAEAIVG